MELFVMRDERLRGRSAVDELQNGRLDLQKAKIIEVLAQRVDNSGSRSKYLPHFRINRQVCITLTVTGLRIVECRMDHDLVVDEFFFRSGQWIDGLRQHEEGCYPHGDFAGPRAEKLPLRLNEVSEIERFQKQIELIGAQLILAKIQLESSVCVFDMREDGFAHLTDRPQAPRHNYSNLFILGRGLECLDGRA